MTREQKRRVRAELRLCGQGKSDWAGVIALAMDYYEPQTRCAGGFYRLRYLGRGCRKSGVVAKLHIGADDLLPQGAGGAEHRAVYAAAAG